MTPRQKREMLTNAIIEDIMANPLEGFNLDIIRDALETHLAHYADRKSTRLNSSHSQQSRMPSSA